MINPVSAAYLQSFFPLPTTAGLVNNFAANDVDQVNREQFNIRVDYARPKDQIFGRFSLNNSTLSLSRGTFNSGRCLDSETTMSSIRGISCSPMTTPLIRPRCST